MGKVCHSTLNMKQIIPLQLFVLYFQISVISGHGNMVFPYSWLDTDQVGWFDWWKPETPTIGCGSLDHVADYPVQTDRLGCIEGWFTNRTCIPGNYEGSCVGVPGSMPWFAPGTAPIFTPCGTAGGNPTGCVGNEGEKFGDCCGGANSAGNAGCGGWSMGQNAEDYDWPDAPVTEWEAGSVQEVAWFVSANHGGGYSFRMCKKPESGLSALTEECFQQTPLRFHGDKVWVTYPSEDKSVRHEFKANRTTEGTFPEGSEWTEGPLQTSLGLGHMIDNVQVPDLQQGEYVLSFRWDCMRSNQVWNICANIKIV